MKGERVKKIKPIKKQRRISELSKDAKSTNKILDGIAKEHSYRRVLEKIEEYGNIDSSIVILPLKKLLLLFLTDYRFFQQQKGCITCCSRMVVHHSLLRI
jgi:hypothetical protein